MNADEPPGGGPTEARGSVAGGPDVAKLARLASRPGARVFVACPRSVIADAPETLAGIVEELERRCPGAKVVPPGTVARGLVAVAETPKAILLLVPRADLSLGRASARELGAFRRHRAPAFVLMPGVGVVEARRLRLAALPWEHRTNRLFGYLEERSS